MWSSVEEKITDGTSGLSPNTEPVAVLIGTCSKGTVNIPVALGKGSKTEDVLGYGELPRRFAEMQTNMADVSIIAVPSNPDLPGTIGEVKQTGDKTLTDEMRSIRQYHGNNRRSCGLCGSQYQHHGR